MHQSEAPNRHKIVPKSEFCKKNDLLMNLDACMAPPNQKNLQKHCKGMQNQGFHAVCKNDITQPSKHLKICICGPTYAPKSHPKLLRISAFDFVTFWITFWLRLGSFFAPSLAQDEPIWPPKAFPVAPKGTKRPQGIAMEGTKGPQGVSKASHNAILA